MATSCYLCQKNIPVKLFNKLGFPIYRCPSCNLYSLKLNKKYEDFLSSYYQKGYFTGDKTIRAYANYQADKPNILKNARNLLSKLPKNTKGNLLDIGCAMGFFMEEAQKFGFNPFGIEISQYAAEIAQQTFPNQVYLGSVEDFFAKKEKLPVFKNIQFDVVILSDLMEHLLDPRKILSEISKYLKNDGYCVIQTGNIDSFWARFMGRNWHFLAPPQHLYFFSQTTLTELLRQSGYKVARIINEGKYLSLPYILYMTKYMNIPKVGDFLCWLINKTFLNKISLKINLFDNMIVYAQKIN